MRSGRAILLLCLLLLAGCATTPAGNKNASIDRGVREAFLYAYPVYQMARTRAEAVAAAHKDGRTIVNRFGHRARLAGPSDRLVTTPNNDTLYSAAWLDLSHGPVMLEMPALPDRYHSVAMMDVFTDHFGVLGTREQRGLGGRFYVTGPTWAGTVPRGFAHVRAPTNDAWVILRVLVDGPADLAAAAQAQSQFVIEPTGRACRQTRALPPSRNPGAQELISVANAMLARGPLPADRTPIAQQLARVGVGPQAPAWDHLEPAVRESWERQLPALLHGLSEGFAATGTVRDGWSYPRPGMGRYGSDEFYRAAVALGGLAALPAEEAVYLTATNDSRGKPLVGSNRYRLTIPKDVPAHAFWSLSIYEVDEAGRLFFTENPIDRYAVGSRTPNLERSSDGSLTVLIQNNAPAREHGNWLPAPPGHFRLTFRAYLPTEELASGRFRLPAVERVN